MCHRREVNLVYSDYDDEIYPIDKLDISDLFYKSAAEAVAASKKHGRGGGRGYKVCELPEFWVTSPRPSFIFRPFRSVPWTCRRPQGVPVFAPIYQILCADGAGHTVVHDTSLEGFTMGMPMMNAPKAILHV